MMNDELRTKSFHVSGLNTLSWLLISMTNHGRNQARKKNDLYKLINRAHLRIRRELKKKIESTLCVCARARVCKRSFANKFLTISKMHFLLLLLLSWWFIYRYLLFSLPCRRLVYISIPSHKIINARSQWKKRSFHLAEFQFVPQFEPVYLDD